MLKRIFHDKLVLFCLNVCKSTEYECCRGNADGNVHKWTEQNGNCSSYKNHGIIRFVNHYPKYIYPVKDVQNQHFSKLLILKFIHKNLSEVKIFM